MIFNDRREAGKKLAEKLTAYQNDKNSVVMGLIRGGIILADEIAQKLNLPLEIIIAKKLNPPRNEEYAIGAIAEGGGEIYNKEAITVSGLMDEYLMSETQLKNQEITRRANLYRGERKVMDVKGKTVILTDDGIATGSTMQAAIMSLKMAEVGKIIVAVPVSAADSLEIIKEKADEVVCLDAPEIFGAVGSFYKNFPQVEDAEVLEILDKYKH